MTPAMAAIPRPFIYGALLLTAVAALGMVVTGTVNILKPPLLVMSIPWVLGSGYYLVETRHTFRDGDIVPAIFGLLLTGGAFLAGVSVYGWVVDARESPAPFPAPLETTLLLGISSFMVGLVPLSLDDVVRARGLGDRIGLAGAILRLLIVVGIGVLMLRVLLFGPIRPA